VEIARLLIEKGADVKAVDESGMSVLEIAASVHNLEVARLLIATGEALYALHETGMPATDAVYRRGVEYLLRTQQPDGSCHVKTRAAGFQPYFESGFPHGHDQWISQSGTVWAVVALSYASPRPEPLVSGAGHRSLWPAKR
jgi:ankyrin repeat protein